MDNNNNEKQSKQNTAIKMLIILVLLSLLALAGRYVYLNHIRNNGTGSVTVPENVIGDSDKAGSGSAAQGGGDTAAGSAGAENNRGTMTSAGVTADGSGAGDNAGDADDNGKQPDDEDAGQSDIEAPSVELDRHNPGDNERFEVSGMLPGDVVTQYYYVKVHHDYDVKVYFEADVTEETKNLGDALEIAVSDVTDGAEKEIPVAAGAFREIDGMSYPLQLNENQAGYTGKYYRIDVSLDTSVGNPYQAAELAADFKWYVTDEEYNAMLAKAPIIPGITDTEESGVPKTGDIFDKTLWLLLAGSSLMLAVMVIMKKRKEEAE